MRLSQAAQETYRYEFDCGTTHANALARAHRVMNAERILGKYGFRFPTWNESEVGGAFDGISVSSDADCGL
jgi:hypothetical protein